MYSSLRDTMIAIPVASKGEMRKTKKDGTGKWGGGGGGKKAGKQKKTERNPCIVSANHTAWAKPYAIDK